jgi:hypothetical protein
MAYDQATANAEAEVSRLRSVIIRLRPYTIHPPNCTRYQVGLVCSCGLDALLDAGITNSDSSNNEDQEGK